MGATPDPSPALASRAEWVAPLLGFLVLAVLFIALMLSRRAIIRWADGNKSWLPKFGEKMVLFIITMQMYVGYVETGHSNPCGLRRVLNRSLARSLTRCLNFI